MRRTHTQIQIQAHTLTHTHTQTYEMSPRCNYAQPQLELSQLPLARARSPHALSLSLPLSLALSLPLAIELLNCMLATYALPPLPSPLSVVVTDVCLMPRLPCSLIHPSASRGSNRRKLKCIMRVCQLSAPLMQAASLPLPLSIPPSFLYLDCFLSYCDMLWLIYEQRIRRAIYGPSQIVQRH